MSEKASHRGAFHRVGTACAEIPTVRERSPDSLRSLSSPSDFLIALMYWPIALAIPVPGRDLSSSFGTPAAIGVQPQSNHMSTAF